MVRQRTHLLIPHLFEHLLHLMQLDRPLVLPLELSEDV
jgi:hypothetical protein